MLLVLRPNQFLVDFKDSPACLDDFTDLASSIISPLKFGSHCWVKKVHVAERALEILLHMVPYVKAACWLAAVSYLASMMLLWHTVRA